MAWLKTMVGTRAKEKEKVTFIFDVPMFEEMLLLSSNTLVCFTVTYILLLFVLLEKQYSTSISQLEIDKVLSGEQHVGN